MTDIFKDRTDYESLQAAVDVLRMVVPMVCDMCVHSKTAQLAVKTVLEAWEIPNECRDILSITDQAYKLRAMLSHLTWEMCEY